MALVSHSMVYVSVNTPSGVGATIVAMLGLTAANGDRDDGHRYSEQGGR
jgi:hypothetical protein